MDKRYATLPLPQQLELRKKAINDVLANPEGVGESILLALRGRPTPHPSPPPQGGRERSR